MFGARVAAYLPGSGSDVEPSTVVDFTGAKPRVLRSGPVAWEEG
jgi:tRNA A37 threonylcarbamoyladenosine synthetase subunit TsaC/SUA5/YrdC